MSEKEKSANFNWRYAVIAIVFFTLGIAATLFYKDSQAENGLSEKEVSEEEVRANNTATLEVQAQPSTPSSQTWQEIDSSQASTSLPTQPSGKFTIVESRKIFADKTKAETWETVNFFATLKNQSHKKKFLTHICFNHSGGVTFGCLLNVNIGPGEEFPIHNSMMFSVPGSYSVWLTWSQDKTNFYRPISAGSAIVKIE